MSLDRDKYNNNIVSKLSNCTKSYIKFHKTKTLEYAINYCWCWYLSSTASLFKQFILGFKISMWDYEDYSFRRVAPILCLLCRELQDL